MLCPLHSLRSALSGDVNSKIKMNAANVMNSIMLLDYHDTSFYLNTLYPSNN